MIVLRSTLFLFLAGYFGQFYGAAFSVSIHDVVQKQCQIIFKATRLHFCLFLLLFFKFRFMQFVKVFAKVESKRYPV